MKYIRPTHVALAMLVGSVAAGPAYACPPCGPMMAPVSAAPPVAPSVKPNININIPRPAEVNIRPSSSSSSGGGDNGGGTKTSTRPAKHPPKKLISEEEWERRKEAAINRARQQNENKNLGYTDADLWKIVETKMNQKYRHETAEEIEAKLALQRAADAQEQARRKEEWENNAKFLKAAAEERARQKAKDDAEAEKKRQAENAPVTVEEKLRQGRVNRGEEDPRPGDKGAPWYRPLMTDQ